MKESFGSPLQASTVNDTGNIADDSQLYSTVTKIKWKTFSDVWTRSQCKENQFLYKVPNNVHKIKEQSSLHKYQGKTCR